MTFPSLLFPPASLHYLQLLSSHFPSKSFSISPLFIPFLIFLFAPFHLLFCTPSLSPFPSLSLLPRISPPTVLPPLFLTHVMQEVWSGDDEGREGRWKREESSPLLPCSYTLKQGCISHVQHQPEILIGHME